MIIRHEAGTPDGARRWARNNSGAVIPGGINEAYARLNGGEPLTLTDLGGGLARVSGGCGGPFQVTVNGSVVEVGMNGTFSLIYDQVIIAKDRCGTVITRVIETPYIWDVWDFSLGKQGWVEVVGSGGTTAGWSGTFFTSVILSSNILELRVSKILDVPRAYVEIEATYTTNVPCLLRSYGLIGPSLTLLGSTSIAASGVATFPLSGTTSTTLRLDFDGVSSGSGTLLKIRARRVGP